MGHNVDLYNNNYRMTYQIPLAWEDQDLWSAWKEPDAGASFVSSRDSSDVIALICDIHCVRVESSDRPKATVMHIET